jgi:hypothetical protein
MIDARQTNRRMGEEWYNCDRCGHPYPRSSVGVQNGLVLCTGPNTAGCQDEPGRDAEMKRLAAIMPLEKPITPLPSRTEDL